jgi:hypothetical protein
MTRAEDSAGSRSAGAGRQLIAVSFVIPAFNEALRLKDGVTRLLEAVDAGAIRPDVTEFVVVDDGSADDTSSTASNAFSMFPHVKIIRLPENRGKGAAVRAGVAAATGAVVVFADADMAIDPAQTPEFIAALAHADLAIGTRAASDSSVDRSSIRRSVMNRLFNKLVNVLTQVSLDDTQCGYKAFRAPVAKLLFHSSVTERFAFDVEILSLARHLGLSISEVPVRWRRVKGSRIRPTDIGSMARDVLRAARGRASAPPVQALVVTTPDGNDGWPPGVGGATPMMRLPEGEVLLLCPFMSEVEVDATATRIVQDAPGSSVERRLLTTVQLGGLAPLSLSWGDYQAGP